MKAIVIKAIRHNGKRYSPSSGKSVEVDIDGKSARDLEQRGFIVCVSNGSEDKGGSEKEPESAADGKPEDPFGDIDEQPARGKREKKV